jgi:hypothetical protein
VAILRWRFLVVAASVAITFASVVRAQRASSEPIAEARVRALTREAQSAARGDKSELVLGLDERFRARWGDFESFPISLVRREDLSVVLTSPFMTYRRTLAEFLQIDRPVRDVPWIDAAVVTVTPSRIDAPDIARVVVERDGKAVAEAASTLKPMTFSNGSDQEARLHAGEVRFAMSAFAPGARVIVSAVPNTGSPFAVTLSDAQLRTFK